MIMSDTITGKGKVAPMLSFREIYDSLPTPETPKSNFIKEIAQLTLKSENTVRQWLSGRQMPDALTQQMISKKLSIPSNVLFPENK